MDAVCTTRTSAHGQPVTAGADLTHGADRGRWGAP